MEVGNITKSATLKSFLHLSYKKHTDTFFVAVLFNVFRRQTLTDNFWGLHKNMNCAFPLRHNNNKVTKFIAKLINNVIWLACRIIGFSLYIVRNGKINALINVCVHIYTNKLTKLL